MSVHTELTDDHVFIIRLAHGPVNALAWPLRAALFQALQRASRDEPVKAVVVTGNDRLFSVGADLAELDHIAAAAQRASLQLEVIPFLHAMQKPVVAAVTGQAIGGGFELAMWCHARVVAEDATLGLPETSLGLMPGAGGTQLLPRAVGLERAVSLIVSAAVRPASEFAGSALIDHLVPAERVLDAACGHALALASSSAPLPHLSQRSVEHPQPEGFLAFARAQARARRDFVPGMVEAINAVALSLKLNALDGLAAEYAMFKALADSTAARAIRHSFLAERAAPKVDGLLRKTGLRPLASAAVVGAGYMGMGIAHCLARAHIEVQIFDVDSEAARRAAERLRSTEGLAPHLIRSAERLEDLGGADIIIEAIVENLAAKLALFEQLDAVAKPGAILATNTSTLNIDAMADVTRRAADVIGLHFFGPAPVMKLIEVVRGADTSPEVLTTALELSRRLRKVAVVARVAPGFIGNRIFDRLLQQALELATLGLRPWAIDSALEAWGWRMGPFRTMDLIGNDVLLKASNGTQGKRPGLALQQRLVATGRLGQKTGRGWYRYDAGGRQALPDPETEALLTVPTSSAPDANAIVERCTLALVNESAKVLQAGIAQRASDIDIAFVLGYGFPRQRGGPLFHADELGAAVVTHKLAMLLRATGDDAWQPAGLLVEQAASGGRFRSGDSTLLTRPSARQPLEISQ